jgi:hypothetical protein
MVLRRRGSRAFVAVVIGRSRGGITRRTVSGSWLRLMSATPGSGPHATRGRGVYGSVRARRPPEPAAGRSLRRARERRARGYRFCLRLSGKDSAVWISPTATMNSAQPSRSAVTPRAEKAGSLEISTAATHRAGFTRQPRLQAAAALGDGRLDSWRCSDWRGPPDSCDETRELEDARR